MSSSRTRAFRWAVTGGAAAAAALLLSPPGAARLAAQEPDAVPSEPVKVVVAAPRTGAAGKPLTLTVTLTVAPGYHIYPPAKDQANIPTTVAVQAPARFVVGSPAFPKPHVGTMAGDEIEMYEGAVRITVPVTPPTGARGPVRFTVKTRYQACTAESCLPPRTIERAATVTVLAPK